MYDFDKAPYVNMLSSFETIDLQVLLKKCNWNTFGKKNELKERTLGLLRKQPPGFNLNAFLANITELYQHIQSKGINTNVLIKNTFDSQQFNVQVLKHHQQQRQRMYQPLQCTQQSRPMIRVELLQTQRGIIVPNYQQTSSHSMISYNPNMTKPELVRSNMNSTALSNNSLTPSARSLINVNLKKLPFFKVVEDIIKPTIMIGQEHCTLPFKAKEESSFKIVLTHNHCTLITKNRDISDGKFEYIYQVQIRICQMQQGCTEICDYMPIGIQIRLNNKFCLLPPSVPSTRTGTQARRSPLPIDCTTNMKLSPTMANLMILNWIPDGKTYVVSMHLVQRLTPDILLKTLQEKRTKSLEETKNYIINKLTDDDPDLVTTNYHFSLLCPLSKIRMKVPAKSMNCEHLQCFDAISFLQMNEKKPTWMCPTCNNPCLYDEIRIENYFLEVLSSSKITDDIKEIEILSDGTWKVYEEMEECKSVSNNKEKPIEHIISIDDSDDGDNDKKNLKTRKYKNISSSFIDLTFY